MNELDLSIRKVIKIDESAEKASINISDKFSN